MTAAREATPGAVALTSWGGGGGLQPTTNARAHEIMIADVNVLFILRPPDPGLLTKRGQAIMPGR
jgi:hypothetical protein